MKFLVSTSLAFLVAPFLPSVLGMPTALADPSPEPFSWDDIWDDAGDVLDKIEDVADDVKDLAKDAWGYKEDGCLVTQCAAALGPTALSCSVKIKKDPLGCLAALAAASSNPPAKCKNCPHAVKDYFAAKPAY